MSIPLDDLLNDDTPRRERKPGDFARDARGTPIVAHPTRRNKPSGTKAELITQCVELGIDIPDGATVPQLKALLADHGKPTTVKYGRPSGLGKQIENMTNIQKWAERATALGCHLAPDLLAPLTTLDPDQLNLDDDQARELLDGIAAQAKRVAKAVLAADRGTHVHELTEDDDNEIDWITKAERGDDLELPKFVQDALVAVWRKALAYFDIEILAVEARVVDDRWRQAGTTDRVAILRRDLRFVMADGEVIVLKAGTIVILDIKTGKLRLDRRGFVEHWNGYAVQIRSYAHGVPYDPDTDTRGNWWDELGLDEVKQADSPTSPIDQRYAIIAHLDVLAALDGEAVCRLFLVDIAAGFEAGERCVWAKEWERRTDVVSLPNDDLAVRVAVVEEPVVPTPEPVVPARVPDGAPVELPVPEPADPDRIAALAERYAVIRTHSEAAARYVVLQAQVAEIPGFKTGGHTAAQADALERIIALAEAQADIPFPGPAPDPAPVREPAEPFTAGTIPRVVDDRDEGADLAPGDELVTAARREYDADPGRKAWINDLRRDARAAGLDFHLAVGLTERRMAILAALFAAWRFEGNDDVCRAAIAHVTGEAFPLQSNIALGACFGALTITEAHALTVCLDQIADGVHALRFEEDGTPVVDTAPSAA